MAEAESGAGASIGFADGSSSALRPGDPRLDGWYHTIELGEGLVTRGLYDHRPILDRYGLPPSMEGMAALDVGTADGFFAFEMERRGAERVLALDVGGAESWGFAPGLSQRALGALGALERSFAPRFRLARAARGSSVEHRALGIEEISPKTVGAFDFVFCGSLLNRLRDPLGALFAMRSITTGVLVLDAAVDLELERQFADGPYVRFDAGDAGDAAARAVTDVAFWLFTSRALEDMLAYADFADCDRRGIIEPALTGPAHAAVLGQVDSGPEHAGVHRLRLAGWAEPADDEPRRAPPSEAEDPRLDGWYHTIELGEGLVTRGLYDHRPILDRYGLPPSMEGMAALDVGTADGFFAFEMERRGAERVVATDVASLGDWDLVPRIQSRLSAADQSAEHAAVGRFRLAHAMLSSEVEHRLIGVYDLSPETVGRFDVVFCGSLLLHVRDPLRALCAIRSVTAGMAVIETSVEPRIARERPRIPALRFGARELEEDLGANAQHWQFTTRGLQEMLSAAGFARSDPRGVFQLPPTELAATVVVAYASQSPSRARMVGRRLTRPARSLAGRLHRRALRNAAMGW